MKKVGVLTAVVLFSLLATSVFSGEDGTQYALSKIKAVRVSYKFETAEAGEEGRITDKNLKREIDLYVKTLMQAAGFIVKNDNSADASISFAVSATRVCEDYSATENYGEGRYCSGVEMEAGSSLRIKNNDDIYESESSFSFDPPDFILIPIDAPYPYSKLKRDIKNVITSSFLKNIYKLDPAPANLINKLFINAQTHSSMPFALGETVEQGNADLYKSLLLKAFDDKTLDDETRFVAADILLKTDQEAEKKIMDRVLKSISAGDAASLNFATYYFQNVTVDWEYATPLILKLLKDTRASVRSAVIDILSVELSCDSEAYTEIKNAVSDPDPGVRISVLFALGLASCDDAEPILIASLKDKNAMVRGEAAHAIGMAGTSDEAAIAELKKMKKDKDPGVRRAAKEALINIGEEEE